MLESDGGGFGALAGAKLGQYSADMKLDGAFGDVEFGGDFFVLFYCGCFHG